MKYPERSRLNGFYRFKSNIAEHEMAAGQHQCHCRTAIDAATQSKNKTASWETFVSLLQPDS